MNKIQSLVASRRFWAGLLGAALVYIGPQIGISEEQTMWIAGIISAWIVGDSLNKTE
jgi:hypothetical protein